MRKKMQKMFDKIKKGQKTRCDAKNVCYECKYSNGLMCYALTCIQQLESTYSQVSKALCGKENATAEEIIAAFDQVKRERDAAVKDIETSQCCSICEYCPDNEKCEANYLYCLDCAEADCKCKECNWGDKLKWRGV